MVVHTVEIIDQSVNKVATFQYPYFGGVKNGYGYKVISVRAEAGIVHGDIMDCGFFLPFPVYKPPDFSGVIIRDCYKVISIGAEAGVVHAASMPDSGFFLPLSVNKPPDFSGMIIGGCYKVIPVGAEAGFQLVSMRKLFLYSGREKLSFQPILWQRKRITPQGSIYALKADLTILQTLCPYR